MMNKAVMRSQCRVCKASVSKFASVCPLCGVSRPVYEALTPIEKEYVDAPPTLSAKFYYMLDSVNGLKDWSYNFTKELVKYITSPSLCFPLVLSMFGILAALVLLANSVLIRFSIYLLVISFVYAAKELYSFFHSMTAALVFARLKVKGGASPYSVHFKTEEAITQMLTALSKILYSFFEKEPSMSSQAEINATKGVLTAIKTLTARIKKYAKISLETTLIIWRNNVYSIMAHDFHESNQREIFINNKIREGEALILRYCWLNHLDTISDEIQKYLDSQEKVIDFQSLKHEIIDDNKLSTHGPLTEAYKTDYGSTPYELPFKMRYHMIEQLMPQELPSENIVALYPETRSFFDNLEQVRAMKSTISQQQILDKAANVLSGIKGDNGMLSLEADDVKNTDSFSAFIDFSTFETNEEELQNQIDKLNAQLKI